MSQIDVVKMSFDDLSTELLIIIFQYCDIKDLHTLKLTCTRFRNVINNAPDLGNTIPLLVTNQMHPTFRRRCNKWLTVKQKCRISRNWRIGLYSETKLLRESRKYMPWVVLTRDHLWLCKGDAVNAYPRKKNRLDVKHPTYTVKVPTGSDVGKFVFKHGRLISGQNDGSIVTWDESGDVCLHERCHTSEIHSVDHEANLVVSGSKDTTVKLWDFSAENPLLHKFNLGDRIWCTAFNDSARYLAVGTSAHKYTQPLQVFDVNSCQSLYSFGYYPGGSGTLHLKWESPNIVMSCGYDKNVRMWDIRIGKYVLSWEDPFYSTVYCFDTDNCCSIIAGVQVSGRAVLWDKRFKDYVQMYFMDSCKRGIYNSPVYSLSFDVDTLYTATDRNLNILDFSTAQGCVRNYNFLRGCLSVTDR